MKKFQFTLSTMLHYKDALLDKEKNALMQLHAQLVNVEQNIQRAQEQIQQMDAEMKAKARKGTTVMELRTFEFHLENARKLLKQLERDRIVIEDAVEKQRKAVVTLSQEVSGLDKLKEKQLEEYNYSVQKEEELRILELVSSKFAAGKTS